MRVLAWQCQVRALLQDCNDCDCDEEVVANSAWYYYACANVWRNAIKANNTVT